MVNSGSFGCEENGNRKASCIQTNNFHSETQSSSPITASSATQSTNDFLRTVDINLPCKADAVEPTPSKTDLDSTMTVNYNSAVLSAGLNRMEADKTKKSFFCSVPLEKVQTILSTYTSLRCDGGNVKVSRKVLCLYCDRTFVNVNLRQKHVERCHSAKQLRRVSLRKHQNCLTSTPCIYCDKFTSTTHTLKELFQHLIHSHSNKYFGCLSCEDRYLNISHLTDHNALYHKNIVNKETSMISEPSAGTTNLPQLEYNKTHEAIVLEKERNEETVEDDDKTSANSKKVSKKIGSNNGETKKTNLKNLRSKKLSVKSSRMIIKRSKRLQAKLNESQQKKRGKDVDKKDKNNKHELPFNAKLNDKSTKITNSVNPYPEFDNYFQVKKITDHSIDNLKISSLTFDDVFDKAFFNRIKCNIQENLLHHIDGKLFKNEESENRISNFEKISNTPQEVQNVNTENYGCELSLNAIAPTTMLLSSQFGEDPESQIEYGSKPSKKKTQTKKDEIHYKYFTRRKYQASILEHKENRDLSKLDMWTQYVIKNRQQKVLDDKKSPKEILDYFSGEEYKNIMKREELNRILDRRGPFEDLREEVSKKAALEKMNGETESCVSDDSLIEIGELLNDILNKVFELTKETCPAVQNCPKNSTHPEDVPEIPSYLNLRRTSSLPSDNEIDKSDKIALICSSQETENFELPSNTVRGKNEKVELTGEWARSRIYVCAACGLKLQNIKQFLEHKSASHQYVWVQHYEFVGNQSELYRHLSIPVLGKVGVLEQLVQCKIWKRSDARMCTKCGKQCNSLGELHRHILECGGDWTWMLVRKKYKYRPFGAKSRRKRRGLVKRIYAQKTEPSEKKIYKKTYDIPRQKASDADTIQRMLANLPAKRASRKIICLKDGFNTNRKSQVKAPKKSKFKCGKLIRGKNKEQTNYANNKYKNANNKQQNNYRRSLRCLNKVLSSRILDTNATLIVRRKYKKKINNQQRKDEVQVNKKSNDLDQKVIEEELAPVSTKQAIKSNSYSSKIDEVDENQLQEKPPKRCSPRIEKRLEFNGVHKTLTDKMNIKRFFPVSKKKIKQADSSEKKANGKRKATEISESAHKVEEAEIQKEESNELTAAVETAVTTTSTMGLRKRKLESKNNEANGAVKPKVKKKLTKKVKASPKKRNSKNCSPVVEDNSLAPTVPEDLEKQEGNTVSESNSFLEESISTPDPEPPILEPIILPKSPVQREEDKDVEKFNAIENLEKELDVLKPEEMPCKEEPVIINNKSTAAPLQSEKFKRKLRKPMRGLNDCIAMLTNKLTKNIEDTATNSIFNVIPAQEHVEKMKEVDKSDEFILKIPMFNEHFHLQSLSDQKKQPEPVSNVSVQELEPEKQKVEEVLLNPTENLKENSQNFSGTLKDKSIENNIILNGILDKKTTDENKLVHRNEISTVKTRKRPTRKSRRKEQHSSPLDKTISSQSIENEIISRNNGDVKTEKLSKKRNQARNSSEANLEVSVATKTSNEANNYETHLVPESDPQLSENPEKVEVIEDVHTDKNSLNSECEQEEQPEMNQSLETVSSQEHPQENQKHISDSEDEIPLSTLVKESPSTCSTPSENLANCDSVSQTEKPIDESTNDTNGLREQLGTESIEKSNTSDNYENNTIINEAAVNKTPPPETTPQNDPDGTSLEELIENRKDILPKKVDDVYDFNIMEDNENTFETELTNSCCNKEEERLGKYTFNNFKSKASKLSKSTAENKEIEDCVLSEQYIAPAVTNLVTNNEDVDDATRRKDKDCNSVNNGPRYPKCAIDDLSSSSMFLDSLSKLVGNAEDESALEDSKVDEGKSRIDEIINSENTECVDAVVIKRNSKKTKSKGKLNRNSKRKARSLESVFDDALQELTDSERNTNNLENILAKDVLETVHQKDEELEKCIMDQENDLNLLINKDCLEESLNDSTSNGRFNNNETDSGRELRRSKRKAKKMNSYNEIDLVDPLLDEFNASKNISKIIAETAKSLFLERPKSRKSSNHKKAKNDCKEVKLSGDELFDLLKATPSENIVLSKPTNNSFLSNFDEMSDDFNDDNFDVLEDILEKSIAVIEENLAERPAPVEDIQLSPPPNDIQEDLENVVSKIEEEILPKKKESRSGGKKKSKNSKHRKHQQKLLGEEIENKLNILEKNSRRNSLVQNDSENVSKESFAINNNEFDNSNSRSSKVDSAKRDETDKNKNNYCEICDKFFCRVEGLTKHKRTLTHISKLSEIEAREAALKMKTHDDQVIEENLVDAVEITSDSRKDLNLMDILETIETTECKQLSPPFSVDVNNANLKLADIISDVLNKPVLKKNLEKHNFSNIITQDIEEEEEQHQIKQYKSLAERKSFDSESSVKNDSHLGPTDYYEPDIANTAGTILEKQITLLENIIENRSSLSYVEDLTVSSSQSDSENISTNIGLTLSYSRPEDDSPPPSPDQCESENLIKSNLDEESFLKPSQYEEISEDSNLRNYDEQKSRKVLNRDEELFLECCSLLKSGSEVSNYSKKSAHLNRHSTNIKMKQCNEPEWLENSSLSRKESLEPVECYSDASRMTTPLGDNFSQDDSNSVTISSNWNMNSMNSLTENKQSVEQQYGLGNRNLSFEKVFNNGSFNEEPPTTVSSFNGAVPDVFKEKLNTLHIDMEERIASSTEETLNAYYKDKKIEDSTNTSTVDNKKMLTKGAMKVFEGLRVSIPTEELNIDKILTCSPPLKKQTSSDEELTKLKTHENNETKNVEIAAVPRVEEKSSSKTKKRPPSKSSQSKKQHNLVKSSKIHDVYDFEETQDNSDVFTRPDFRSFRNNYEKIKKIETPIDSDNDDSQDCVDAVNYDAFSSSTSSITELPNAKKTKTDHNITKKKCMIMGRIFKNAAKSRIIDENIRNIPVMDNTKLVEDFVFSCPEPSINDLEKSKIIEEEMNAVFDRLTSNERNDFKQTNEVSLSDEKALNKNNHNRKKIKGKNKKRGYGHSDSSDDEFKLQKSPRKRVKKKNNKVEDNCINLEQELKECIGVASRKSQRKCTSGKQNVLIEYWSSDESPSEVETETQIKATVEVVKNDYQVSNETTTAVMENVKSVEVERSHKKEDTFEVIAYEEDKTKVDEKQPHRKVKLSSTYGSNRRKRTAVNPLYHWSSSSEDESRDLIEVKPLRDELDDDEDRPIQHGWIVGDSPKKLVTMLAQAKGKKCEVDGVKEHGKKRTNTFS